MSSRQSTFLLILAFSVFVSTFIVDALGGTITFDDWAAQGVVNNKTSLQTGVITVQGVTFSLTIESAGGNIRATISKRLAVHNGIGNTEIDQGSSASNVMDDESLRFTLSVAGAQLTMLRLNQITLVGFGAKEKVEFTDGTKHYIATGAETSFNYDGCDGAVALSGLTALSTSNISQWELTLFARDGSGVDTRFFVDTLSFDYAINTTPHAPMASDDFYDVVQNTVYTNDAPGVLANDSDINGDSLTARLIRSPKHGTLVSFQADGSFTYQPNTWFTGTDTFRYLANDGKLDSNEATVTLTVAPVKLSLPTVFQSNMILQRDLPLRIWGQGPAGQTVSVSLSSGQYAEAIVHADGQWALMLEPMATNKGPLTMTIRAPDASVRFTDLAVGEVWLCTGQSNMAGKFVESKGRRIDPTVFEMDLSGFRFNTQDGWHTLDTKSQNRLSEVAFYFGFELYKELKIPIGLIVRAHSATPIQAWMSEASAEEIRVALDIPQDWNEEPGPKDPGAQFVSKIDPIVPIAIRGNIWYQGERNAKTQTGWEYRYLLPHLIDHWRELWALRSGTAVRNFPFYYVQVPTQESPVEAEWPWLRDAMRRALDLTENTGMAVFYDYGPSLHPENKEPAGRRLALWALAKDYGRTELVHCGPLLDQVNIVGDKAVLSFKHVGSGLRNKSGEQLLKFFEIAGEDGKYTDANAWIEGDTVVVQSPAVPEPVYVRYLFRKPEPNPEVSLINAEGLPASSFMTDDFMPPR